MFGRKNKGYDYFESITNLSEFSMQAAKYLQEVLTNFANIDLAEARIKMHGIEHAADEAKTEMMKNLMDEFLPPIERDDIISLSHCIDDVTDSIEDVLIQYDVSGSQSVRNDSIIFTKLIIDSCESMNNALAEMRKFGKSDLLFDYIDRVKKMKSEGDRLYVSSLRNLYQEDNAPETVLAYSEIFIHMKRCCEHCKLVTNDIERIVMKNL